MQSKKLRIVFMGTPEFAAPSLEILLKNNYDIIGVVTAPDKPAGRGKKMSEPEVKKFALEHNLNIFQPVNLKDKGFLNELKSLKADLQVVVAFRMLPEVVWAMPPKGTINLHASLLPQYRGAAPINRVLMNGDSVTGATTFFINQDIDTGNIIMQEKLQLNGTENAGELHDKLMIVGAGLVLKTVDAIMKDDFKNLSQDELVKPGEVLKKAPKIFKEDCKINWERDGRGIYNHIRGLSPFPGAYTHLQQPTGQVVTIKIFECEFITGKLNGKAGSILVDKNKFIDVIVRDGIIRIFSLQMEGKKRLRAEEFIRGYQKIEECSFN